MDSIRRANPHLSEIIEILNLHLEKYRGNEDEARSHLSHGDNLWIDNEVLHCMTDTRYFLSNYYAIKTEDEGFKGLYPLWDSQEILYEEFRKLEKEHGFVKAMVNKSRQMGGSTYVSGELFHKTIFSAHINTIIVTQDADQTRFILDMYVAALDFLPWWMRPRKRYGEAGKFIDFDEKDDAIRSVRPGLKTRIYGDNGNKPTGAGRGKTFARGHLDELAFWKDASGLTESLFPTMNAADGFYVMISTPRGRNTPWHNLWKDAESGDSEWSPIYIPFYRREKTYSMPIPKGEPFILTEDEQLMRQQIFKKEGIFVKDEVFNWRRKKIKGFISTHGDDKMFLQEYSSTAEESFQSSAVMAFPRGIINRLSKQTVEPIMVGEISYDWNAGKPDLHLRTLQRGEEARLPKRHDRFHVWEKAIRGERYVMGVDVSLGNEGGDYSCVQVIKLASGHQKDEQVACWHGMMDPQSLAEIVFAIGWLYNEALAAVEVNSMGMVTNNDLVRQMEYENIYRFKRLDRLRNFTTDIIGWWTDEKSKRALISKMSKTLLEDTFTIRDRHTVDEFYDFTEWGAEGDRAHDDYVMAIMIALYCGHEGEFSERQKVKKEAPVDVNRFQVLDRWGTEILKTTSRTEAERVSKQHPGSSIQRHAGASAKVMLGGESKRVPADLYNTDYSPIHDKEGSTQSKMYEDGMEPEEMTPEAVAEYEAEQEEAEDSPNAWLYS